MSLIGYIFSTTKNTINILLHVLIRFGAVQNMAEHRSCLNRHFVEPWQTAEIKITKTSTSDPFTPPSDGDAGHVEISSDIEADAMPRAFFKSKCRTIFTDVDLKLQAA